MKKWSLNSWKNYPAKHLPVYQSKEELDLVLNKIKKISPSCFCRGISFFKKIISQSSKR